MHLFVNRTSNVCKIFNFQSKVYLYRVNTVKELGNLLKEDIPDWVIGTSYIDCIYIIAKKEWKNISGLCWKLIIHELIHIILNNSVQYEIPIWIAEGLAVCLSDQYSNNSDKLKYRFTDIYQMSYENSNLYDISGYLIQKLISNFGLEIIINDVLEGKYIHKREYWSDEYLQTL